VLGVAVVHVRKAFLSSASRIACRWYSLRRPNIDQLAETEKPHPGEFLHPIGKFTRTSE